MAKKKDKFAGIGKAFSSVKKKVFTRGKVKGKSKNRPFVSNK